MADTMRSEYRKLDAEDELAISRVKKLGQEFVEFIELTGAGREASLAVTKMEEAVMWAVKHITK